MKKLIILMLILLVGKFSFGQYPVSQSLGSDSTLVTSKGGLKGRIIIYSYADTTAANLERIRQYAGAMIYTTGAEKLYYRNSAASSWIELGSSSGGVNIYNSDGSLPADRTLTGGSFDLSFNGLTNMSIVTLNQMAFQSGSSAQTQVYFYQDSIRLTNGLQSFHIKGDTGSFSSRVSYSSNLGSTFTLHTLVDKNYVDSVAIAGSNSWQLTGNNSLLPSTNFLGSINNEDVRFRINNQYYGRFSKIGTTVYLDSLYPGSLYLGLEAGAKDTTTDASIIRPSIGFGNYALRNYAGASTGGGMIAIGHMALMNWIGDSTTGSGIAIGTRSQARNIKGFRNVSVGVNSLHNLTLGVRNTAYGFASGEWTSTGSDNSFYGESSARLNTIGTFNAAFGNSAAYSNTGSIKSVTVNSSSSDWTTATIVFSTPDTQPFGFNPSIQATGTVIISGGEIIGVDMTEIGAGYSNGATGIITGDGSSVSITINVVGGSLNSAFGSTALYSNRTGYGNVGVGVQTGYGDGANANDRRVIDSFNTFIGTYATARGANPMTTPINKSMSLGYKSIVSQSNSIVIGATGADQPNVGVGTTAPDREFDVNGDAIVRDTLTTSAQAQFEGGYNSTTTSIVNNSGATIPSLNSLLDNAVLKVGTNTSSDAGISIYRARASNFGGAAITTYRTNSNDLATKASLIASQSLFQNTNYGVAADNTTVSVGGLHRIRAFGTPKTTYVPAFYEWQLRDTSGGFLSKFLLRPHVAIFGDNVETTTDDASVQFRIESTSKGILIPRLNTTQQNAINSPATSLLIFNTDSAKYRFYNGSAWETIGGGSGTVTSVGSGFGLTGGPITTSGTLVVDTTSGGVTSWVRTKKVIDSLSAAGWGTTPPLQDVLTAGSTLTGSNNINWGTNSTAIFTGSNGSMSLNSNNGSGSVITVAEDQGNGALRLQKYNTITGSNNAIYIYDDSLYFFPANGNINIDSLRTLAAGDDEMMTWNPRTGVVSHQAIPAGGTGLTIGTSTIASGSTKRILYDSAATLSSNANLVYDFTNNRLGVGTESPSFLFHAYENTTNTTTAGARIENAGNGDAALHFLQNTSNYSIGIDQSNSSRFYISANATLGTTNGVIIASDGKVGLNGGTPAAGVTLGAGSASAFNAPLKFNSGTLNTTAEAGAMEYNGNFYVTKVNAVRYGVGGSLEVNTTDVGNVGTGVDDLMSFSVPAGTMSTNGDYIEFSFTFTFAANVNNKTVRVVYGATEIYNSTAQIQSGGSMEVVGKIIRTAGATQKVVVSVSTDGTLFTDLANYTTAAETLSGAVTLKATGEATSNDDIVNTILTVKYYPNN